MNGITKAPNAFPAPNQLQLTPESMPGLTPPQQVSAHNGAGRDFLQGMNITLQGHCECLGRQMQTWKGSYSLDSRRGALQQLVANAQPHLGTAAIAEEQIDLLFDEMDGSGNTQQEQVQAFDQMIMLSIPNVEAPEPWISPPSTTFEDVFRQQDEEAGVELGPYSSMLFGPGHSMSGSG
ncbi:hypothetical protein CSIM01_13196 [Colletotrichum simmondsii]|uniref:Uncharacterized protein n=1 Tax=Colletotrichum simmondsii TaxID=703756 RepID=A0A135TG46_9PEZI|nr:hypothetical protein CSIM01_13196 [Colletotrichum simmondsii]